MPMTVPMQRGGAKSLPAEIKTGGTQNGLMRLRASSPGYPFRVRGVRGLGRLGDMVCDENGDCYDDGGGTSTTTNLPPTIVPTINPTLQVGPTQAGASPGYVCISDSNGNCIGSLPIGSTTPGVSIPQSTLGTPPTGYTGPTIVAASAATPAAPSGYQWATMLNQSGQTIAKVLAVAQGGSTVTLPNGTSLVYGSPASAVAGAGANLFTSGTGVGGLSIGTLVLLAGGLILLSSMGGGGRR